MSAAFYDFLLTLSEQARTTYLTMEAAQGRKEQLIDTKLSLTPPDAMVLYYIIVDYRQLVAKNPDCKALYETTINQLDDTLHGTQDDDTKYKHTEFTELVNMLVWRIPY